VHIKSLAATLFFIAAFLAAFNAQAQQSEHQTYRVQAAMTAADDIQAFVSIAFDGLGDRCALLTGENPDRGEEPLPQQIVIAGSPAFNRKRIIDLREIKASSVALDRSGELCAVSSDRGLLFYGTTSGKLLCKNPGASGMGPVRFSPDGKSAAAVMADGRAVVITDAGTAKATGRLRPGAGKVKTFTYSRNGDVIAVVSEKESTDSGDYQPSLISVFSRNGRLLASLSTVDSILDCTQYGDSDCFITCGTEGLSVFSFTPLQLMNHVATGTLSSLTVSSDGRHVAVIPVMQPYAEVYDMKTGAVEGQTRRFPDHCMALAACPGRELVAVAFGRVALLYDLTRKMPLDEW